MSILDTFVIVFEGDATKAKAADAEVTASAEATAEKIKQAHEKGEHAAHAHGQAVHELGGSFHVAAEGAEHLAEKLKEIAVEFFAILGVAKLVEGFFEQAEKTGMLGAQAKSLGLEIGELDMWTQAVQRAHGSSEDFISSITTLSVNLERVALGAGARTKKFFQDMQIEMHTASGAVKSGFQLLPELVEKFEKMDPVKALAMGRGIGLGDATIRLLQQGGHEIEELTTHIKHLGLMTKHDADVANEFHHAWLDVQQTFRNIGIKMDTEFLPVLKEVLEWVSNFILFLGQHTDLVTGFFAGLVIAVGILTRGFWLLDASAAPFIFTVLAIAAALAVFAFVYDDVVAFLEGGNSVIGELSKKWPIIGEAVKAFVEIVKAARIEFDAEIEAIKERIGEIPEALKQWNEIADTILEPLKAAIHAVFGDLDQDLDNAIKKFSLWDTTILTLVNTFRSLKNQMSFMLDMLMNPLHPVENFQKWQKEQDSITKSEQDVLKRNGVFDAANSIGGNIKEGVVEGNKALATTFKESINALGTTIVETFENLGNLHWDMITDPAGYRKRLDERGAGGGGGHDAGESDHAQGTGRTIAERQNNPGNIRASPTSFKMFDTALHGFEAMGNLLLRYEKVGRNSVAAIIGAWAPPSENDTGAYINTLAKSLGVTPNQALDMHNPNVMARLMQGIAHVEVGRDAWDKTLIDEAANNVLQTGKDVLNSTRSPLMQAPSSQSSISNSHLFNAGGITINTPNDQPETLADRVNQLLEQHYNDAMPNYSTGTSH